MPGRADGEDDVALADGVDVALLRQALGRDGAGAAADQNGVREDLLQVGVGVAAQDLGGAAHVLGPDGAAAAGHAVELLDQAAGLRDGVRAAHQGQLVAARVQAHVGFELDALQVGVALAEQHQGHAVVVEDHAVRLDVAHDGNQKIDDSRWVGTL